MDIHQNMGEFLQKNEHDYFVNSCSFEKIQMPWKDIINPIVQAYSNLFGDEIHSIYLRGSVAQGNAICRVSDIDTYAVISPESLAIEKKKKLKDLSELFSRSYSFASSIDLVAVPYARVFSGQYSESIQFMIKTQSLCLFGEDLSKCINPYKPSLDLAFEAKFFEVFLGIFEKRMRGIDSSKSQEIKNLCSWIMKRILRAGGEVLVLPNGQYTRDLNLCVKSLVEHTPSKSQDFKIILQMAINPIDNKDEIYFVVNSIREVIVDIISSRLNNF